MLATMELVTALPTLIILSALTVFGMWKNQKQTDAVLVGGGGGGEQAEALTLNSPEVRLTMIAFSVIFIYVTETIFFILALSIPSHFELLFAVSMSFVSMLNVCNAWFLLIFSTSVRNAFIEFITCGKYIPGHAIVYPM